MESFSGRSSSYYRMLTCRILLTVIYPLRSSVKGGIVVQHRIADAKVEEIDFFGMQSKKVWKILDLEEENYY